MNWYKQSKILKIPEGDIAEEILGDIADRLHTMTPQEKQAIFLGEYDEIWIKTYKVTSPYTGERILFSVSLEPLPQDRGLQVEQQDLIHISIDPAKSRWMDFATKDQKMTRKTRFNLTKSLEHEIAHIVDPKKPEHVPAYPDLKNQNVLEKMHDYYSHPWEADAFDTSIIRETINKLRDGQIDDWLVQSALKGVRRSLVELGTSLEDQDYLKFLNGNAEAKQRFLKRLYQYYMEFVESEKLEKS